MDVIESVMEMFIERVIERVIGMCYREGRMCYGEGYSEGGLIKIDVCYRECYGDVYREGHREGYRDVLYRGNNVL